jgi:competence protein ComEC
VRDTSSSSIQDLAPRWRSIAETQWPALLAGSACFGLSVANWVSIGWGTASLLAVLGLLGVALLQGGARIVALALVLVSLGLWWGSLRLDALAESVLVEDIGATGQARVVTTGPARKTGWAVRIAAEVEEFRGRPLREHVLLTLPVGRSPPRGAILEADVHVAEPRAAENGFDERAWLARQGIHVVLRARTWRQVGRRGGVAGIGDRLRDRVEAAVGRGTSGIRRGVVLGVLLGEDEGLGAATQQDFRASGLYHLLAVSGQNVAFIAGGMLGLGWLLRLSRTARELLTLSGIGAYLLAVGWQPSVVRAGVAGALASLAWLVSRPRDRWHFLALGALVLLAWTPTSLLEPGFQLSFVAVAAIFLGLPVVRRIAEGYPLPRRVAEGLGVALVCGLATAPVVLLQFGRAPVYTVPANALAEPAMPLVLGLGLLAAVVDPVAPGAAAALAWLAGWAAAWLDLVARTIATLPNAQVGPRGALVVLLVCIAATIAVRNHGGGCRATHGRAPVFAASVVLVLGGVGWWSLRSPPQWHRPVGLRVTFLDVGQGDSVLLETPSARVLVDEGPPEADVAGQLSRMGIHSLSAIVLTHPERDHVGGAAAVLRRVRVGSVLDPELAATGPDYQEATAAMRARHVPVRLARAGAEFRVGGLVLHVLSPPDAGLPSENPNLNAVVLIASYGEIDVFLPADAESDATGDLPLRDVEIVKVGHHGSEDPGLPQELRVLRPEVAVISVGRGNDYGHPRPETLAALAAVPGLALYRTDLDGRVVVESDGRLLRVRTSR